MKRNADIVSFAKALLKTNYGNTKVKLLSINYSKDGYYILNYVDEHNNEQVLSVPCYEEDE